MIQSNLLKSIPHAFFTRKGGVSENIYESLNVGLGSRDNPKHVLKNRTLAAQTLKFNAKNLITPYQIHSNRCLFIKNIPTTPLKADALVTDTPDLLLGIVTADCLPILLYEPKANIIAAAHAGWKGAANGILQNTIATIENHNGKAHNIIAAIGPAIQAKSYQVKQDFYEQITDRNKNAHAFFTEDPKIPNGYYFDLPNFARTCLWQLGVTNIDTHTEDTLSQPENFFSYRRACLNNEQDYGRQLSAIGLKK